jgi:glycerol-3-phosphate dehydrogenase
MAVTADAAAGRAVLGRLAGERFDVVVIGGGITGAGIALTAAQRGLSVALLEADDFASGTSSRSSKLIHGGLRYLLLGDFALVREGARERLALHAMAPHLAEPLWMLLPARRRRDFWKYRLGVSIYEYLGTVARGDRHHNWTREALAREEPALDTDAYPYGCAYREYLTDDARLVLAVLRAATAAGAVVANHLPVRRLLQAGSGGTVEGVAARCALSGAEVEVRGRVVVNAAGPWLEQLLALDGAQASSDARLHLSKGVHVLVERDRLPVRNLIMTENADGRPVFVLPRGDVVWIGTTDTTHDGPVERWPRVEARDVDYLLAAVSPYFRGPTLTPGDVRAAWAGLRPLIAQPGKQAKDVSRKDEIWVGDGGLISIAGGKLTGFRPMAGKILAAVGRALDDGAEDDAGPVGTLPGGDFDGDLDGFAAALTRRSNLTTAQAQRLVRLYGSEAATVAERGPESFVAGGRILAGEVAWAVDAELALTLEDVVYRRTRAALYAPEECRAALEPIAAQLAERLGWSEAERQRQVAAVRSRLDADMAWR